MGERTLPRHTHSQRALRALIKQLEPDEIEVRRAIRAQELIMQCGGDTERAAALAEELGDPFTETSDLATFLTQAAFTPDAYGLVPQAQRFAVACAANWILDAADSVVAEAERQRPRTVEIRWEGWSGQIDAEGPADTEAARLTDQVCGYIAATRRVRPPGERTIFQAMVGAVLLVALVVGELGLGPWQGGTMMRVVGLVGVGLLVLSLGEYGTYPQRRNRSVRQTEMEQERARQTIPLLVDEAQALLVLWDGRTKEGLHELRTVLTTQPFAKLG